MNEGGKESASYDMKDKGNRKRKERTERRETGKLR